MGKRNGKWRSGKKRLERKLNEKKGGKSGLCANRFACYKRSGQHNQGKKMSSITSKVRNRGRQGHSDPGGFRPVRDGDGEKEWGQGKWGKEGGKGKEEKGRCSYEIGGETRGRERKKDKVLSWPV